MDALQRRVILEDMVQYKLFLVQSNSQQTDEHLPQLVDEILAKVAPFLIQYIWQHQPFNLKYHPEKGDVPAHIEGQTQFGDNVEDEWFIVYLLQQITEAFPELAARVEDNDGEFLLIEAADYLPKWLNPDTSENRVFFYKGELHILPCPSKSSPVGISKDVVPSVAQALALLSTHPVACRASPKISSAVMQRLAGYPEKIKANLHRAHCFIPAGIATVLAQRPDLVAPAVSAFYLRDPVDLQACRSFNTFPPDALVLASVTFTRCLYAQLQQQQFISDRRSGFTLPPRSHPQYKAHELGMKLAHGFEILCSKCRLPSSEPDAPVSCNPQWKDFVDSLKRNGYFRVSLTISECRRSYSSSPGEEVLQLLHSCNPLKLEELKKREAELPQEDSDQKSEEGGYSLVAVSRGMKDFLSAMSSHEGAELPWSSSAQPFSFDPDSMANALDRLLGSKEEELDSDDLDDDDDDDDEEEEEEQEEENGLSGQAEMNETETLDGLRKYMDQMDQELMSTNIGQSFNLTNHNKAGLVNGSPPASATDGLPAEETEEIQPLDIDLNLVTNLLESLSSQAGLAGPASNLLQSLGIHLPPNSDPA
uniref:Ecdysoneless homolog (Drosophila) n=1 Tax=Sparus aurata TaxID=8175 RepID=A0A671YU38_SPAAU